MEKNENIASAPEKSPDRVAIVEKIALYEKNGWFDRDVEDDPPTRPIEPGEVDYTLKKLSNKIASEIANRYAKRFFDKLIKKGELIIEEVRGIENYRSVEGGALITSNHFNPYEQYAVFKSIERELGKKRLYKVIREGNYTSFPGLYGYFFRHCNTLPLASNHTALREFMDAVGVLLDRGEKILIYPEQAMWWNYKKPRPLKDGAFRLAAKNNSPIIPFFLTMRDSDRIGGDGFPIQAYTVHILPPIFPDPEKSIRENTEIMKNKNFELWKEVYESTYGIPLSYS